MLQNIHGRPKISMEKELFVNFAKQHYSGSRGLPKGSDGTFITKPFTKWSKATGSTVKNNAPTI